MDWDDLVEWWREGWGAVSLGKLVAVALFAALLAWLSSTGPRWVPFLDSANLAFHEAGHLIYGIFGSTLALYGGTLGQLTFPVICAAIFTFRREPASLAVCVIWFGQNLCNIVTVRSHTSVTTEGGAGRCSGRWETPPGRPRMTRRRTLASRVC